MSVMGGQGLTDKEHQVVVGTDKAEESAADKKYEESAIDVQDVNVVESPD